MISKKNSSIIKLFYKAINKLFRKNKNTKYRIRS